MFVSEKHTAFYHVIDNNTHSKDHNKVINNPQV